MKFKYIVFEDQYGLETPVIFPDWVNHDSIKLQGGKVVSAGFVNLTGTNVPADTIVQSNLIEVGCHGESVNLKVKSRPNEDSKLIEKLLIRTWNL